MFNLYLLLKLTEIKEAFNSSYMGWFFITFIVVLVMVFYSVEVGCSWIDIHKSKIKNTFIILFCIFCFQTVGNIISIILPTTPQMAVIIVGNKAMNNENLKRIPDKLLVILEKKADEYIKEIELKSEEKK